MRVQSGTYVAAMLALAAIAAACATDSNMPGGGGGGNLADTVKVSPVSASVPVGAVTHLSAIPFDADGNSITGVAITWSSSNTAIATVDASGNVHGVAAGTVNITAAAAGAVGSAAVAVTATSGGIHLVFSTYLGGTSQDQIRDVAVDAQGYIYIAGGTESPTFPTTAGAYDQTPNGNYDVFVSKLTPQGQLVWSTLIGGPGYDRAYGIELDPQGNIYIAGRAGPNFPVTAGAFQTTFAGGDASDPTYGAEDGFVCKLANTGATVTFCSYMGTSDNRIVRDLALDPLGNIYLASSSDFGTFPSAWFANAYKPNRPGGVDGLVVKVSNDGSQVLWATFIGGSGDEAEQPSIRIDASGNAFVLYATESSDAPTPNGFDHSLGGLRDLYLIKLNSAGNQLLFGTYVGGSGNEGVETHELALDPQGNPVIGNNTTSTDFPTTAGVLQTQNNGLSDAFIARISSDGSQLLTSTLLGGAAADAAEGISIDPAGNIYITGNTQTPNLPFLIGGFQATGSGGTDMIVMKLSSDLRTVIYGTYLGGNGSDAGRAAAVTPSGEFVFGGTTQSSNFPTLLPIQSNAGGGGIIDGALAKIAP